MQWTDLIAPDVPAAIARRLAGDVYTAGNITVVRRIDRQSAAEQTVIVPVFNQAGFIGRVLSGIVDNLSQATDLVVVVDGATDGSEAAALHFLDTAPLGRLSAATLLRADRPIFETRCDNIGFALSRGAYVFDVQADIEIRTEAFDRILTAPMRQRSEIFSVSGRSGGWFGGLVPHRERLRRFPLATVWWKLRKQTIVGCEEGDRPPIAGSFYTAETVVRGPWALRRSDLIRLGFLDQEHFFLGSDDHDLHARGWSLGLTCAYTPVQFAQGQGSTRQPRSGTNAEIYQQLSARSTENSALNRFLRSYRPRVPCRKVKPVQPAGHRDGGAARSL